MRIKYYFLYISAILLVMIATGCTSSEVSKAAVVSPVAKIVDNDWLLVPFQRAGNIKKDWSIQDVIKNYGQEALTDGKVQIYGRETRTYPATTIHKDSDDAITLVWADGAKNTIAWIEIYLSPQHTPNRWKLNEGYYVGMRLDEMEKASGRSIPFCGFYNGVAGFVPFSEYGGLYAKNAGVQFRIGFTDKEVGKKFMGDKIRWSASTDVKPYNDKFALACIGIAMNQEPQLVRD